MAKERCTQSVEEKSGRSERQLSLNWPLASELLATRNTLLVIATDYPVLPPSSALTATYSA
jgi:hypothetical protein